VDVDVPRTGEVPPVALVLTRTDSRFGSAEWLTRSTKGTEIIRTEQAGGVTGAVVDAEGRPIAGAKVFRYDGPIVTADQRGEFRVEAERKTQFVMYAFHPGFRVWFGTPTAGDVLKIVLEKKPDLDARAPNQG
jgi:hypothetical protein